MVLGLVLVGERVLGFWEVRNLAGAMAVEAGERSEEVGVDVSERIQRCPSVVGVGLARSRVRAERTGMGKIHQRSVSTGADTTAHPTKQQLLHIRFFCCGIPTCSNGMEEERIGSMEERGMQEAG